jgi:CYTH domain-containing protein
MLTTDMTNLKYVAVEVIKNPGTKLIDVECGAFMGIITHENDFKSKSVFIVLQNAERSVRMYNLAEYGIMTIQAETVDMKYMTVFMKTDQKEAIEVLHNIVTAMKKENRLFAVRPANELINVDSYKDLPEVVLSGNNLSSSITDRATTKITTNTTANRNNSSGYHYGTGYNTTGYTPPKPTVLSFKRKGKLPAADKLTRMENLVKALSEEGAKIKVPIPKHDLPNKDAPAEKEEHTQTGPNKITV